MTKLIITKHIKERWLQRVGASPRALLQSAEKARPCKGIPLFRAEEFVDELHYDRWRFRESNLQRVLLYNFEDKVLFVGKKVISGIVLVTLFKVDLSYEGRNSL